MSQIKHIILLGPPGAGKGTFSSQIRKIKPEFIHISTGDIFRENLKNKTSLGLKAKSYIDEGKLVPDDITNNIVKNKLEELDNNSWILDGYPRNIRQTEFLSNITEISLVILLSVEPEIIIKRILGRFTCQKCNKIYNKFNIPPKIQIDECKWVCDDCGAEVVFKQRSDDTEETSKNRLDIYEDNVREIIQYYNKKGKLKEINAKCRRG